MSAYPVRENEEFFLPMYVAGIGAKSEFGDYNVGMNPVSKENWFEFESLDKKTRISMYRDDLAAFVEELTRAAQILGVQV